MPDHGVPELNSLVEVRGQQWVVTDVKPSGNGSSASTLVALESVEEDAYGERLSVIWEIEPGRRVLPHSSLPEVAADRFDPPERLAAFLDALRWTAVNSAESRMLQAPFRSGVTIEPYQLEPVARAVAAPRVNQLLSDDVGLGKTIEAGLVALELLLRHRIKRIMIVCPAALVVKWHEEMLEKFGLVFQPVNTRTCADLRRSHGSAANPFAVFPLTIVSLQWLRGAKGQRLLRELLPADGPGTRRTFDLLILDEAHHVAPSAPKQRYAVDSKQTKLIRGLAPHFEHRLFLSATPHNGYSESFEALLEIIDPQRFARGIDPDRSAVRDVVVRRMKRDIVDPDGRPRFPRRRVEQLELHYPDAEKDVHELLSEFTRSRRARRTRGRRGRRATDLVTLLLKKRLISSPAAFAHTVAVYLGSLPPQAAAESDELPSLFDDFDERTALADDDELFEFETDTVIRAAQLQDELSAAEVDLLKDIESWATGHLHAPDAKAARLIAFLAQTCKPAGNWNDERVVVFSEYRDTQLWLRDLLAQHGLGGDGLRLLHGGVDAEDREQFRLAFQAHPRQHPVRILLATDAAGEGIDLQAHCHSLVNYDIPFNPNKLEQRIGRIDRYGQSRQPEIWHFVPADWRGGTEFTGELEYLSRVARKVAQVEEDLGEVNTILAADLQRRMLGDRTVRPVDRIDVRTRAQRRTSSVSAERDVSAQVRRLTRHMDNTVSNMHLTPNAMRRVVDTALELANQQPLKPLIDGQTFEVQTLTKDWVRAAEGLTPKFAGTGTAPQQRPVTFDPEVARGRDDVVLAHLNHPLMAMSTRLLRAAVSNHALGLHRVAAVVSDDPRLETVLVGAFARFVVISTDGSRLHEEVLHAGGWLPTGGRFRRLEHLENLRALLESALADGRPASTVVRHRLVDAWPQAVDGLKAALDWRRTNRQESLTNALVKQATDERDRVNTNIDQFTGALRVALREEPIEDGVLDIEWDSPAELAQRRKDREQWRSRLDQLERERDRELSMIAERYREPKPHLFPLAVCFVVPGREATR